MSLTEHEIYMKRWEAFQALHALLNKAPEKLDYPLNTSYSEDENINQAKRALEKLNYLFDVYAHVIGNKTQLQDTSLRISDPKIEEELFILNLMAKDYVDVLTEIYAKIKTETNFILNKFIESHRYRFNSVDVSNLGLFEAEQYIDFKSQFTVISGPNGSGKTTIRKKLEANFSINATSSLGLFSLSFLIFFTEESLLQSPPILRIF